MARAIYLAPFLEFFLLLIGGMKSASDDGSMGFCPTVTFPLRTRKLALQSSSPVAANRRPKSVVRMETENNQGEGGTGSGSEQYGMKLRLREESEAPFRKVRMLIYSASAASAGIGGFVAGSRIVAALTGVSGKDNVKLTQLKSSFRLSVAPMERRWSSYADKDCTTSV